MAAMACSTFTCHESIVLSALEEVLQDPSINMSSSVAADALKAAAKLLQWCKEEENKAVVDVFSRQLVADLSEPFVASSKRRPLNREKLWKALLSVRSSSGFITCWVALCERASALVTPILYQHLTDLIFRKLVREKYGMKEQINSADSPELSYNEANVLRYAAGYVVCHISEKNKEEKSHFRKRAPLLCQTAAQRIQ